MDLICYAAAAYPDRSTWIARLQSEVPVDHLLTFETLGQLESGLLRPLRDVLAVVLFPADEAELNRLVTVQDLMSTTRIILVLPSFDPHWLRLGHLLRPRFMTCRDQDYHEVGAVLRKMAANVCRSMEGVLEASRAHPRRPKKLSSRASGAPEAS